MRNMQKMTKFISLSLIVALLLTPFSSCKTSAESNVDYTDEDVEELANVLEAIFEECVVYSDDGNFFGLDQDVLNDKVLNTEYAEIIDEFEEQDLIVDKSLTVIPNNREKLIIDKILMKMYSPLMLREKKILSGLLPVISAFTPR